MINQVIFWTLRGALLPCMFFCQLSALIGNTRALIPTLAGICSAAVVAVIEMLLSQGGEMERSMDGLSIVLLFGVPLIVFAAGFTFFQWKHRAARQIPRNIRWLLALLPALAGLAVGWDIALIFTAVAILMTCLFSAMTGSVPAVRPLGMVMVCLLNGVLLLALLRNMTSFILDPILFTTICPIILLTGCIFAYRPLPPGERFYSWKLGADSRGVLLGVVIFALLALLPYTHSAFLIVFLACLVCSISGNTRAILPAVAGLAATGFSSFWLISKGGSFHMGMAPFLMFWLLAPPLVVFGMGYFFMIVASEGKTRLLPMLARVALAVAGLLPLAYLFLR